jgi:PAS domain S-box-containing protein
MSTQARLTISSVLVMTAIVAIISVLDLGYEMVAQFQATLEHGKLVIRVASNTVVETLNHDRLHPWRETLRDAPGLGSGLTDIMSASHAILEIAVCDSSNLILVDSDPKAKGKTFHPFQPFEPIVTETGWLDKVKILNEQKSYQLAQPLGQPGKAEIYVYVVIYPGFIKAFDIVPTLKKSAGVALASVAGALCITLLFSFIAFRPLGRLGNLLDTVAKGEYDPMKLIPVSRTGADEFGIMATKVSLLGQQLRGAQFDFSDLRGNFERLLDQLEDAVLMFGRDRRLVVASGAVEKFLGRMRADLVGLALPDVFPPNTTLGLMLAQAAQTGRPVGNRRVPIARHDGSSFVVLLSVDILEPLNAGNNPGRGTGLLVRLRDPEAARQVGRQLQTADRDSAISRITSGVAHEVKNPLNAILMHVEVARMKLARNDTDVSQQMEIISREILRLDRVVKTFLDFTRPVELHPVQVSLDSFVREIVELAGPQAAAASIRVALHDESEGAQIRVDVDLMKQALLNVVVNAIQAMPQGGDLRIECAVREDQAEIRISDTGVGIPPELRDKIFRLYYTTKPQGSGIGLAMTYRIVQLHDGTIDFTSEPAKGTTFMVRLPLAG